MPAFVGTTACADVHGAIKVHVRIQLYVCVLLAPRWLWQWLWQAQCKDTGISNFLAVVLVNPVQGQDYRQFPGSGFVKPSARTQLLAIFSLWCWWAQYKHTAPSARAQLSAILWQCFGKPSARTQLSAIFWQWFWWAQCKHAAPSAGVQLSGCCIKGAMPGKWSW